MPRRKRTKLKSATEVAMNRQIVNPSGNPVYSIKPQATSGMYESSSPFRSYTRHRIVNTGYNDDYKNNVTLADWNVLLSRAREMYANLGSIKNAIHEIAELTIGSGWTPQFVGSEENMEWGEKAVEFLTGWFEICDIRGSSFDFYKGLKAASIATDRDGDCLCVLTTAADGKYPMIQWLPAHRIGSRWNQDMIEKGPFKGKQVINGIIVSDAGTTIGYNIKGNESDGSKDSQISVFDAQLVFDSEYVEQNRGLTSLAPAINDWDDYKTIKDFEIKGIKHASNFSVQMYVPPEEIDDYAGELNDSPFRTTTRPTGSRDLTIETLQGGETTIWKPDSGAKLEVLNSNRPSTNTATFLLDHVLRHAFLSLRWPVELTFDLNSKGATTKLVIAKAQRRIESRQNCVIYPVWKRVASYGIAKAIKLGILPKNPEWYKLQPTYPREFTLDNFRDTKSDLELYSKCWMTGTQISGQYGYSFKKNIVQKAQELKYAQEVADEYGLNRNDLVTPTQQGNAIAPPEQSEESPESGEPAEQTPETDEPQE